MTVIDELDLSVTIQDIFILGQVSMVNSLRSGVSGTDIELSWGLSGADEYRIYRSSSPTLSLQDMTLVGVTDESSWSELAPIASNLYYAVTKVIDGKEVLWLENGINTVNFDASSVTDSIDSTPTGSITVMSIP